MVLKSSGSEFIILDQKWEFKDGLVQIYQYGVDGASEPLIGEVNGDTIILRLDDGELRYLK